MKIVLFDLMFLNNKSYIEKDIITRKNTLNQIQQNKFVSVINYHKIKSNEIS